MIELLERFVVAFERIATALESGTVPATTAEPEKSEKSEKPPKSRGRKPKDPPASKPADSEAPTVTRDQVREALRVFRKDHDKAEAVAILEKFGAASITAAPEEALADLLEAFTALD